MSMEGVLVKSPYSANIHLFNSDASSPDIDFVVPGKGSYRLHRSVLAPASSMLAALFETKQRIYGEDDAEGRSITWIHDIEEEGGAGDEGKAKAKFDIEEKRRIYRDVVVKLLRLCYGEDQTFKPEECGAALAVLTQLALNKCETEIKEYMKLVAKSDVATGVKMLEDCVLVYKVDRCGGKMKSFCEELAKIVMRKENVENHFEMIVTNCLMKLPHYFLDRNIVGYGGAHGKMSEFNIRVNYVKCNGSVDDGLKAEVLKACNAGELSSEELKEIEELEILKEEEMTELRERVKKEEEIRKRE